MHLRYLQYLRLIIEHGSFAAAAQRAGVSQPAISHGMKQLQGRFATPLLVRSGRVYVPTALGLQVASEGASLAEQVETLGARPARRSNPGVLRVGLTPSAALVCGPTLHDSWCAGHPRRTLQLSSADEGSLLAGLRRQEFDLVISPRPRGCSPGGITCHALYALQPLVYARTTHPLAGAETLAQLQDAAWAAVGPSVRGPVNVLTEAFAVRRLPSPRVVAKCGDYASMLNLVTHSDLLGVIPHPSLLMGDSRRLVTPLRLRETLPLYEMWLFQAAGFRRRTGPVAQALLELGAALSDPR